MRWYTFPLFTFLLLPVLSIAQQENIRQKLLEQIVESIAEDISGETDQSALLEELEQLSETPINLNSASLADLEKLPFLKTNQIQNLLAYREKYGQFLTINEIVAIDGFTAETQELLSLFVTVIPLEQEINYSFKHEVNMRTQFSTPDNYEFQEASDTLQQTFQPKLLLKYKAIKGDQLQLGFTAENDQGEDFFGGKNKKGFDFYSGFLVLKGKKVVREVYLGDFQWRTGQGLIHWTGYGARKSADVANIRMTGQGFKGSTSVDENLLLRGAATTLDLGRFTVSAFISSNKVDANRSEIDSTGKVKVVSSLQATGYHRTESELFDENSLGVTKTGANATFTKDRFRVGVNAIYQHFDAELQPDVRPYNLYYFRGRNNFNISTDFLWIYRKINVFGETAMSQSLGKATLLGVEAQPLGRVNLSLLYRSYAKDFHSIGGNAFGEFTGNSNEKGLYAGMTVLPFIKTKIAAYFDTYATYWMKYNSFSPVRGTDIFLQTDYNPTRNMTIYLRYKSETATEKTGSNSAIGTDEAVTTNRVRLNLDWRSGSNCTFHLRAEWVGLQRPNSLENGWLLYAGLTATTREEKLSGNLRLAYFNTDSYNTRIYAYENDMPLSFYIPAYYGKGVRFYAHLKFQLLENLTLYFKYAQNQYFSQNITIGSETAPTPSEIKVSMKYRF
jgi:hypothetical protein